jgi:hypothetical protein
MNPYGLPIRLEVIKQGLFLSGNNFIEINPNEKQNYELHFSPKQIGKFKGRLSIELL